MSEKEGQKDPRNTLLIVLAVIAILAILVAVWAIRTRNENVPLMQESELSETTANAPAMQEPELSETTAEPVEPLTNQIALPQFAWIYLAADTTQQTQTFQNPPQNFAQFRVSIVLDGDTLWESELLKPGETSAPVVLSRPLEAGEYEAYLVYVCFTDDDSMSQLNGANSPITLKVY